MVDLAFPRPRRLESLADCPALIVGCDIRQRRPALGSRRKRNEGEIGIPDDAFFVDIGNADRRVVEKPGKPEFGRRCRGIGSILAIAREHQRAARHQGAGGIIIDAMDDAHRHGSPVARREIEIESLGQLLARLGCNACQKLDTGFGDDVIER